MNIRIEKTTTPLAKPKDETKLGFGKVFTDHMFIMNYKTDKGWFDPRVVPFGYLSMHPAATVLHYGQEIFEGLKAYRAADGRILLFRARDNFRRMNQSAKRLTLPELNVEDAYEALVAVVKQDKDWVPKADGATLYIRPTMFGNDESLGVHGSDNVLFYIILSPSGAYYPQGLKPIKIYVEDKYVRAVKGGMGYAKTGGNYAASLLAGHEAEQKGFAQVLWLDGVERKYVEEVGAMNMAFVIDDCVVTAPLEGTILSGITRDSILTLAREMGVGVSERRLSIDEIIEAQAKGKLSEAFGIGTAAVVSPVGALSYKGNEFVVGDGEMGKLTKMFYDTLTDIQYGRKEDKHGWVSVLE